MSDNPIVLPDDGEVRLRRELPRPAGRGGAGRAGAGHGGRWRRISERRLYRLLDPAQNNGLPAFLVERSGLNSGFMIVQYTAASLVSECKSLAHPASVDSIPSSAGQEDHVSMGMIAARHARDIVANAEIVVAIEALAAAQALDLARRWTPAAGTAAARAAVREVVAVPRGRPRAEAGHRRRDRAGQSGALVAAVEAAVGPLD